MTNIAYAVKHTPEHDIVKPLQATGPTHAICTAITTLTTLPTYLWGQLWGHTPASEVVSTMLDVSYNIIIAAIPADWQDIIFRAIFLGIEGWWTGFQCNDLENNVFVKKTLVSQVGPELFRLFAGNLIHR